MQSYTTLYTFREILYLYKTGVTVILATNFLLLQPTFRKICCKLFNICLLLRLPYELVLRVILSLSNGAQMSSNYPRSCKCYLIII